MRPDVNKSTKVQISRQNRHNEWLRLFVAGASYQQIADKYDVSLSTVKDVMRRALKLAQEERRELADAALQLHIERLEIMLNAHMPIALNVRGDHAKAKASGDLVLRTLDRLARLQGLDTPQTAEITVHTVTDLDREIAGLATMIRERARDVGGDLPETPVLDGIVESVSDEGDVE